MHIERNLSALAVAAAPLLASCGLSLAELPPHDPIRQRVGAAAVQSIERAGFERTGVFEQRVLATDEFADVWIVVPVVEAFAVVAACDETCADLWLALYDDDGDLVSYDEAGGPTALVTAFDRRPGRYRVRMHTGDCGLLPCRAGLALYVQGLATERGTALDEPPDFFVANAWELVEGAGWQELGVYHSGTLAEGREAWIDLVLGASEWYSWVVVCDRCDDVDLRLLDESGAVVDRDIGIDAVPWVSEWVSRDQLHTLIIEMFDCDAPRCRWAAGLFVR